MLVVSVINQKGGVGKTTTTVNLGAALASLGRRVLLLDLDPQANLTTHLGIDLHGDHPTIYDVLVSGRPLAATLMATSEVGLTAIPSNLDLSAAEMELVSMVGRETLLKDGLADLERTMPNQFDIALLDCPPSLGLLTVNALVASDEVLVPLQTEFFALQGMAKLTEVIDLVHRRLNPRVHIRGIVACKVDKRPRLTTEVLAEVSKYFGELLFRTMIRPNVKLAEAPSFGKSVLAYAPESNGAFDYIELAREYLRLPSALDVEEEDDSETAVADSIDDPMDLGASSDSDEVVASEPVEVVAPEPVEVVASEPVEVVASEPVDDVAHEPGGVEALEARPPGPAESASSERGPRAGFVFSSESGDPLDRVEVDLVARCGPEVELPVTAPKLELVEMLGAPSDSHGRPTTALDSALRPGSGCLDESDVAPVSPFAAPTESAAPPEPVADAAATLEEKDRGGAAPDPKRLEWFARAARWDAARAADSAGDAAARTEAARGKDRPEVAERPDSSEASPLPSRADRRWQSSYAPDVPLDDVGRSLDMRAAESSRGTTGLEGDASRAQGSLPTARAATVPGASDGALVPGPPIGSGHAPIAARSEG